MPDRATYAFESERRLRAGFIGCGGHSYRNVYPVLQYVPVDLVAVCDVQEDRAKTYARTFGAERAYTDHHEMLERETLDCVFVVTGYDEAFRVRHASIALDVLRAGAHVWVEKPPVNDLHEVEAIRSAMSDSGCDFAAGFKKAFAPANRRLKRLMDEHGPLRTVSLRYAQLIPTPDELAKQDSWMRLMFLDHLGHPLSLLQMLAGRARTLFYTRADDGAGFALLEMESGVRASLTLARGHSYRSMAERTEAAGDGGLAVAENNTRVTLYRPGPEVFQGTYGRLTDFTATPPSEVWEPEFSLGQLYNKGLFVLGYYDEIAYFCDRVLEGTPVETGGIDYAEEGVRIYDAFSRGPDTLIRL